MSTTDQVAAILANYGHRNAAVREKLQRLLASGRTAGSGKLVILPVDQGFEHGAGSAFGPNPAGYDPLYHFRLALAGQASAYAAPLGALECGAAEFAPQLPLILKLNNSDPLVKDEDPCPALTASVDDAVRLGCVGFGYTIYPGSAKINVMYEQLRLLVAEAHDKGLLAVVWSYPRGKALSKKGETALDVVCSAAYIACSLGADVVKVKPPTDHLETERGQKAYAEVKRDTLRARVSCVVQAAFNGRRIVIFSGGEKKDTEDAVLNEIRELRAGGAFGSIIGRNTFQRPMEQGVQLLHKVCDIYTGRAQP